MRKTQSIIAATLGTVALIGAFSLTGAGAANASTPSDDATNNGADTSCWLDADTGQSLCVPAGVDLIAAVQDEAGITINVPSGAIVPGVSSSTLKIDALLAPASTASTTAISELFDDINYGGNSLFITASGCGGGESSLVNLGWNDRASSFKSFDGCETAIWQNIDYSGTKLGYYTNKSSFGSMNDQASSLKTE